MIVDLVVGARPNYMKAAAIYHAWQELYPQTPPFTLRLIDTGQHHAPVMSSDLIVQLGLPQPHIFLSAGGASTTEITANILLRYGAVLQQSPPAATLVVGDVTSTLAAALAARQAGVYLVHVEAGLRSGDRTMPEEHNRILTDAVSDLLLVTSESAKANLLAEGIPVHRIAVVGNTMIDTLRRQLPHARKPVFWEREALEADNYLLLTMHRPGNVDAQQTFLKCIAAIAAGALPLKVVFPLHTRTEAFLKDVALPPNIIPVLPQGYPEFLFLLKNAKAVLTDSGGASEEAAFLKKRCLVLRTTTERPETVTCGSALLIGENERSLGEELRHIHQNIPLQVQEVPLWNLSAGKCILEKVAQQLL